MAATTGGEEEEVGKGAEESALDGPSQGAPPPSSDANTCTDVVAAAPAPAPAPVGDGDGEQRPRSGKERWRDTREVHPGEDGEGRREKKITYGRRIARLLSRYDWYNPHGLDRADDEGDVEGEDAAWEEEDEVPPPMTTEGAAAPRERTTRANPLRRQPSLDQAWSFYEHTTLPRYVKVAGADADARAGRKAKKERLYGVSDASPEAPRSLSIAGVPLADGERTELYDFRTTTERDLAQFGTGQALHLWSLRVMAALLILAGIINIPNMIFFASESYSADAHDIVHTSVVGSAICTDQAWVACPSCVGVVDQESITNEMPGRFAFSATNSSLWFILKNKCSVGYQQGMIAWGTFLFLLLATVLTQFVAEKQQVRLEQRVQTADDYTVRVCNPPDDARDPEEWKAFFAQFVQDTDGGHITCCTIAVDNRRLLNKMKERRRVLRQLEFLVEPGVTFDPNDLDAMVRNSLPVPLWKRVLLLSPTALALQKQINALDAQILAMKDDKFPVTDVFVTFESEHSLRRATKALSLPCWTVAQQNASKAVEASGSRTKPRTCCKAKKLASNDFLFRGEVILLVERPSEPSAIRWEDLSVPRLRQCCEQLVSFLVFAALTVGGFFLVRAVYQRGWEDFTLAGIEIGAWPALTITALNLAIPNIVKFLIVELFESHRTVGSLQVSFYTKVTLFRWVNTAIITLFVTPFTNTLSNGDSFLINQVKNIFVLEMATGPLLYISDYYGQIERHVFAPRAADQWRMNMNFRGCYSPPWSQSLLSERKTTMTKMVFLACWYATIFPTGFFYAAGALLLQYITDKFCLLRVWAPAPRIGAKLSTCASFFFIAAMVLYSFIQTFQFSAFPYDNTCEETNSTVSKEYVSTTEVESIEGDIVPVSIDEGDSYYLYCNQDLLRRSKEDSDPGLSTPLPDHQREGQTWMTDGQAAATVFLSVTLRIMVASGGISCLFNLHGLRDFIREFVHGSYKPSGNPSNEKFSEQTQIAGYVPQTSQMANHFHPFLACDISNIDPRLIGWVSNKPYHMHNLFSDFPSLSQCFSVVRQWPLRSRDSERVEPGRESACGPSPEPSREPTPKPNSEPTPG